MKTIAPDSEEAIETEFVTDGDIYYLTNDVKKEIHTSYILEVCYENGISESNAASVKPFIFRNEANDKLWEVHIPMEAPTAKMNTSYFGQRDDASNPANGLYFVRKGDYPFAFFLSDVTVDAFKGTILKFENEKMPIDEFFPEFLGWSRSGGKKNLKWYKNPVSY